ncbi:MAG: helix-turn-helix domain-containing protein [Acidimicrobiia bacterium]|nr:helix-turn-helix domain-containing protein [Acidimicrobiia bacterium]
MDVELIHWPEQLERRNRLASRQRPRLLLVAPEAEPPRSTDLLEDWVRLPAKDRDVRARVRDLHQRVAGLVTSTPEVDGDGVLRHAGRTVALSELHRRITRVLTANMGKVVTRRELIAAGWEGSVPERNTVDVHMARLRRRLSEVGLSVRTVRARGFILESSDEG